MADGQPTLSGQGREAKGPVEMFGEQLGRAALLPRRETAAILASGAERRCVGVSHVRAKEETEIIQKELGEGLRRVDRGKHHLRHVMQCRIDMAMNALELRDPARLGIISKRIQKGTRHRIVYPDEPYRISRTRF